jgi:hypothetical protein
MGYLLKQSKLAELDASLPLKTTSSYNLTTPGKVSYLLGGDTRRQVGADLGSTVGLFTGGIAGSLLARKHLMTAADAIGDLTADEVKKGIKTMPGKWGPTKALGAVLKKTSLLSMLPQRIKNKAALGVGLLAGVPLLGYAGGGLLGHYMTDAE